MLSAMSERLQRAYPEIFMACHRRHVRDDESGNLITPHQASVLDHLDTNSALSVGELAGHLGVTAATMSITLKRLIKGGYVERAPDVNDARKVLLLLTQRGKRLREQNSVLEPDLVLHLLRRVPAAKREEAIQGLELLSRAAQLVLKERSHRRSRAK